MVQLVYITYPRQLAAIMNEADVQLSLDCRHVRTYDTRNPSEMSAATDALVADGYRLITELIKSDI